MKTIIFYSGHGGKTCDPEVVMKDDANIMLTFHSYYGKEKVGKRFQRIIDARKAKSECNTTSTETNS